MQLSAYQHNVQYFNNSMFVQMHFFSGGGLEGIWGLMFTTMLCSCYQDPGRLGDSQGMQPMAQAHRTRDGHCDL